MKEVFFSMYVFGLGGGYILYFVCDVVFAFFWSGWFDVFLKVLSCVLFLLGHMV